MKALTYTTALFVAMAATSVFAHHPSEGISPNFDMIDDQLEAVESPHQDMDMYEVGNADGMLAGSADRATEGWESSQVQPGEVERPQPQTGSGSSVDTMGLLEDVTD